MIGLRSVVEQMLLTQSDGLSALIMYHLLNKGPMGLNLIVIVFKRAYGYQYLVACCWCRLSFRLHYTNFF